MLNKDFSNYIHKFDTPKKHTGCYATSSASLLLSALTRNLQILPTEKRFPRPGRSTCWWPM